MSRLWALLVRSACCGQATRPLAMAQQEAFQDKDDLLAAGRLAPSDRPTAGGSSVSTNKEGKSKRHGNGKLQIRRAGE